MLPYDLRSQAAIRTPHRHGKLGSAPGWKNRMFISLIQLPGTLAAHWWGAVIS